MSNIMIKIYADLIVHGVKTIENVPEKIRAEVAAYLGIDEENITE